MNVTDQLKQHEGYRQLPYRCTAGKLTIGYGFNIEDVGLARDECDAVLEIRIKHIAKTLSGMLHFYNELSETRRAVLINMVYNLGLDGFMQFKKMLSSLSDHDYKRASYEMLNSKWASQVGKRAQQLAKQMEIGDWQC